MKHSDLRATERADLIAAAIQADLERQALGGHVCDFDYPGALGKVYIHGTLNLRDLTSAIGRALDGDYSAIGAFLHEAQSPPGFGPRSD